MRQGDGERLAMVAAAGCVAAGCLDALGFYTPVGLRWMVLGAGLVVLALARPGWLGRDVGLWGRRALRAVGPAALLVGAYQAALQPRPAVFVAPLGLLALVGLALAVLLAHEDEPPAAALGAGLLLWAPGLALLRGRLYYADRPAWLVVVSLAWLAAVVVGLVWLTPIARRAASVRALLALAVTTGLLVRGGTVLASPDPVIDVQAWLQQAPQALLRGRNPYAMALDSPYGTPRALRRGISQPADPDPPTYPPGIILTCLPTVAGLDPRWLFVAGWLALAGLLARRGASPPLVALLLLLPTASFTAEQAWFDGLLALGLVAGLLAGPRGAGAWFAWTLSVKQTAVYLLPAMARRLGRSPTGWVTLTVVLTALVLPFVLWSPPDFVKDTLAGHQQVGLRADGLCLPVWLARRWSLTAPGGPLLLAAAALAVGAAWRARATQLALAGAAGLLAFNLCGTRAFCNHYEVVAALLLAAAAWPEVSDAQPEG